MLFFFLTSFSLFLLVHNNEFQRSKYLLVFQEITGRVYLVSNSIESYLYLKQTNTDLMERLSVLEEEVQTYKNNWKELTDQMRPDSIRISENRLINHYIRARVVSKQVSNINNYILLDKGSKDGVKIDMAVVSAKGIVGVVMTVSPNFSRVIPVLNSDYHPSCIIKNTGFFGPLYWDGEDPRYTYLTGLPRHVSYSIGDTIVTSGYSATYPEGVFVGVIEDSHKFKNEEFISLKVHLFTDFSTLNEVFIIKNPLQEEQVRMEKGDSDE